MPPIENRHTSPWNTYPGLKNSKIRGASSNGTGMYGLLISLLNTFSVVCLRPGWY